MINLKPVPEDSPSLAGSYEFIPNGSEYLYKIWGESWQEIRHNIRRFPWYKEKGMWIDCGGVEDNGDKYLVVGPLREWKGTVIRQRFEDENH